MPDRLSIMDPNQSESDSDRSTSDEGSSEGSWNTLELSEDDWSDVGSASFGTESARAAAEGATTPTDHEWVMVREPQAPQLKSDKRPDPSAEGPAAAAAAAAARPLAMFDSELEPEPESASTEHGGERWASYIQASLEGVLSFNQAYDILVDLSFNPGYRNVGIQSNKQGARQPLYKESPKRGLRWNPGEVRPSTPPISRAMSTLYLRLAARV